MVRHYLPNKTKTCYNTFFTFFFQRTKHTHSQRKGVLCLANCRADEIARLQVSRSPSRPLLNWAKVTGVPNKDGVMFHIWVADGR
jgi:hypothetical protein